MSKRVEFRMENDPILYRLSFNVFHIAEVEKELGMNLLFALRNLDLMTMGQLAGLLYAASKAWNKGNAEKAETPVSFKDACELLGRDDDGRVYAAIAEVYAFGGGNDEDLFRMMVRKAKEDPMALVKLLARIQPLIPNPEPAKPEAAAAAEETPAVQ